jgi:dolichyl-phosphate-mannose--protein O-mannosyl transferase
LPLLAIVVLSSYTWKFELRNIFYNLLKAVKIAAVYLTSGAAIYVTSYLPMFYFGYTWSKFVELQQQMYSYHTNLKATHPFDSPALTWPLNLRPVWMWVDTSYQDATANIYAMGNPIFFWLGLMAVVAMVILIYLKRERRLFYLLLFYLGFWVPWISSPRIMFLYHYLPALTFMSIILAYTADEIGKYTKRLRFFPELVLVMVFWAFVYFYPYWSGMAITNDHLGLYQWLPTWK